MQVDDEKLNIIVGGIVSLTTIDYPGCLSLVVFCQGCPWRCVYCHNKHLQKISRLDGLPWDDVSLLIDERKNFIDAVVFSGGEPLIQNDLDKVMKSVKDKDLLVGLHTTGVLFEKFAKIIGCVDWVGFDVKAPFEKYGKIIQQPDDASISAASNVKKSLELLLESRVNYEVRVTLDNSLEIDEVLEMTRDLKDMGVQNIAFQVVRDEQNIAIRHAILANVNAMNEINAYFPNLTIRS